MDEPDLGRSQTRFEGGFLEDITQLFTNQLLDKRPVRTPVSMNKRQSVRTGMRWWAQSESGSWFWRTEP